MNKFYKYGSENKHCDKCQSEQIFAGVLQKGKIRFKCVRCTRVYENARSKKNKNIETSPFEPLYCDCGRLPHRKDELSWLDDEEFAQKFNFPVFN